jgi:hypothetical protein
MIMRWKSRIYESHPQKVNILPRRMALPNELEGIKSILWVTVAELEAMIRDGAITDGFTIAAFTRARLKGLI